MKKTLTLLALCLMLSGYICGQGIPSHLELKQYEPKEQFIISGSHGDAEIVLGWWGWYGMTSNVAKVLEECADKAIANPDEYKYTFEYDAASWQFYDKFFPEVIQKIKKAIKLGSWEVTGGTYSIHLPYMVGIESNVRQWTMGQSSLHEILGASADVFHYQEFLLFPQLPMYLKNVGIDNTFYANHLAITGCLDKDWRGVKMWESANGDRVKAISEYPGLFVDWPDLLHIRPTNILMKEFFDQQPEPKEVFTALERDFHFDAADLGDSYGNMVSVLSAKAEYELLTAERIAVINRMLGGNNRGDVLSSAWNGLLTFQSHGIIYCASECYCVETGSSLWEAGKYHLDIARNLAKKISNESLVDLSSKIIKPEKGAKSLVVFNPMAHRVSPILSQIITLEKGFAQNLVLKDDNGVLPFSLDSVSRYDDGSINHATISFKPELPPMGIKAFYLYDGVKQRDETDLLVSENSIENNHIRVDYNSAGILSVYSKSQDKIILGRDVSMESMSRYDKTYAIKLRNTFRVNDRYYSKGNEIIANDDVKISVAFKYESNLAYHNLILTLYRDSEYFDLNVEHISKSEDGALMQMSFGENKERMWLDFFPAFKGKMKCNTVGDVQDEYRDSYYSNSWLNIDSEEAGFTILHKGIHSYDNGYVTQEWREKREYAISAHLACTVNEWVPGMVVFNSQFGDNGVLRQEFRLLMNKESDEFSLEKEAREFMFNYPIAQVKGKKGKNESERSFVEISKGEAFVSAFYGDDMTGGKPHIRFYNPKNEPTTISLSHKFGDITLDKVRFDSKSLDVELESTNSLYLAPRTMDSYLLSNYAYPNYKQEKGVFFSNIPYTAKGNKYYFDAPMESYRFVKQYAKHNDGKGNISYLSELYEDLPFTFEEKTKDGIFRVFEGSVNLPKMLMGRDMRLVTLWNASKQYGVGTCILTDDYDNRADEPISVYINDVKVENYHFNITDYVKEGDNKVVLRVLAEEPSDKVLLERSSVKQYLAYDMSDGKIKDYIVNAGFFEDIKKSFLRVGKVYDNKTVIGNRYCVLSNPDFSLGSLKGWKKNGEVSVLSDNNEKANYYAQIIGKGSLEKEVFLKEGDYYLRINTKSKDSKGDIILSFVNGSQQREKLVLDNDLWQTNSTYFNIASPQKVKISLTNQDGEILYDDLNIIKKSN